MEFFFFFVIWFFYSFYYMFFLIIVGFFLIFNFSWLGLFFFSDSLVFLMLFFLSIFILGVISFTEVSMNLVFLSQILILVCLMFFISSNFFMIYIFFELSMIPILVMILGFGSQIEKINSSYYLMFYASICSFPFLFIFFNSFFYFSFSYFDFFFSWELLFFLSLTFMMKFPIYFLHLWLPKAHVEAPTSASMILAGLLLKLGTAGFWRILGSLNFIFVNFWLIISFLGMIICSFCSVFQSDSKSLAAYSSVTHMSFLLLSLLYFSISSKNSALMLMLAHGYTSTMMFFLIGEFFHMANTRMIYFFSSFFSSNIFFSLIFALTFLSNMGTPPSLSFVSEFIIIVNSMIFCKYFFIVIFIYFTVSFYYSLFLIACSFVGKNNFLFLIFNSGFGFFLGIMMLNLFWISFF